MKPQRKPRATVGAGLAPLAVLPVFLDLKGRRAVVAGGDAGALWKARLLSAAGAEVDVFAPAFASDLAADAVVGPIRRHARAWQPADLDGAAFAVAALEAEADCAAFVREARRRGVIVNAVDKPHLGDVQFGAIVNRSPLVVGISTAGAAPVFAQRIRAEIEALLPDGFAGWVAAAARWRARVSAALGTGARRIAFWDRFAERAFASPDRRPDDAELAGLLADAGRLGPAGSVALVGAGPGDPELLTLKALRALRTADVILYDDLVAPEILAFVRREAQTMQVGKTGHAPSCRQTDICDLVVKLARKGRRVVRLKGGDPLIFARAAEELDACRAAGIPVEIVPAVTTAQGAAAALGVPLTHRNGARRLQYVTAHDRRGSLPDLDWRSLADPTATTAVYMPRRHIDGLLDRAMANGLPAETPAVGIVNATRRDQVVIRGIAADLARRLADDATAGPAIVLIGEAMREPAELAREMRQAG